MNQQDTSCSDDRLLSLLQLDEDGDDNQLSANHIAECQRCQSRLEQLAAEPGEWQDIRDSLLADDELDVVANSSLDNDLIDNRPWARERWRRATAWSDSMAKSLLAEAGHPEMLGRIGRYDVERLIGSGGMGVVFKAYDTELNRPVAVKLLAPYLAGSGAARKRFAREARAAAAVVDDHVVPIHNVETNDEHPFLVMKYIAGGSLQQRLDREGPLEVCEVLRIGIHTAKGLAAAHAQGLIHRDVKPSNILLDEGVERALLTDFGLARATDDASLTRSGFHPGTPHYMSPEQVCGEAIDARSDLFGLGCVLYALCTGHPPFRSETSYAVLRRITDDTPRSIRETNPDVPIWLEQIVMKLLAKSPDERFESAESVAELLEDCLAHVQNPTSTPLPEPVAKLVKSFGVCGNDMRADSLDDVRYPPIGKLIAAAAFASSLIFAGVLIVLELNKGTLTIESEADDVPIRIMQGDNVVKQLTVTKSPQNVRIAAGNYVIAVDGRFDVTVVDGGNVSLQRGETDVVKIVVMADKPSKLSESTEAIKLNKPPQDDAPPFVGFSEYWQHLTGMRVGGNDAEYIQNNSNLRGGLWIGEVDAGSPAAMAGLKMREALVGLGPWEILSESDLRFVDRQLRTGKLETTNLKVHIYRPGEGLLFGHITLDAKKIADIATLVLSSRFRPGNLNELRFGKREEVGLNGTPSRVGQVFTPEHAIDAFSNFPALGNGIEEVGMIVGVVPRQTGPEPTFGKLYLVQAGGMREIENNPTRFARSIQPGPFQPAPSQPVPSKQPFRVGYYALTFATEKKPSVTLEIMAGSAHVYVMEVVGLANEQGRKSLNIPQEGGDDGEPWLPVSFPMHQQSKWAARLMNLDGWEKKSGLSHWHVVDHEFNLKPGETRTVSIVGPDEVAARPHNNESDAVARARRASQSEQAARQSAQEALKRAELNAQRAQYELNKFAGGNNGGSLNGAPGPQPEPDAVVGAPVRIALENGTIVLLDTKDGTVLRTQSLTINSPAKVGSLKAETGNGIPLVVDDRIYYHAERDEHLVVWCFRRSNGDVLWRVRVPLPLNAASGGESHGNGSTLSPPDDQLGTRLIDYQGQCVRAEDGVPIAGAVARFFIRGKKRSSMRLFELTTTDKDGHFRINCEVRNDEEVDLARCQIAVTATGRASRVFFWQESSELTRIEMRPSASLKGRITDSASRPVAGARVRLGPNRMSGVNDTVTDQDGRFEIADLVKANKLDLESGISNVLHVEHPDGGETTEKVDSIPSTVDVTVKISSLDWNDAESGTADPQRAAAQRAVSFYLAALSRNDVDAAIAMMTSRAADTRESLLEICNLINSRFRVEVATVLRRGNRAMAVSSLIGPKNELQKLGDLPCLIIQLELNNEEWLINNVLIEDSATAYEFLVKEFGPDSELTYRSKVDSADAVKHNALTPEAPLLDLDAARLVVETLRRRWKLLSEAYKQGEVSLLEVLTAARDLAEAELTAAESSDERRQAGQRRVDVLQQLKTTVESFYKSAEAGEADVLAVEAELQKAQAQLRKAQADERKLLDHFSRLRTLDAVTSAYNESTQQMRLELFDPPIPDLTSEQMRTAMLDAANVYRKKGQLSIASALEQSVEKDSLPHGLTFGGTMGTASQTFRQVLPGLTFENGPGQHTVVFLTKAELRYSRNGWSSSTWGDIHPPLTGNWELVSINQQDNTLAPASFSQWKQQHASWTTIVIDDSTLSTIGDDVAVYDLTVDYHSGPLPAFRLSQKGEVKHEGVLMGNGFVDDTSLQIAIDIDGKSTPTTFNTDGDRTTRLKYRRVQKEPQQTKAMPEREQGEERNDAELSTPQATLNYLHRRSFADRADFPAECYTDEALLDLSGMLLQNLVMMSGLSQIGAQTGGLLGMDDGVPVVSGGPASFHLQVDALLEKHKEKNPPEVSTKAFELLAKLTLGAVFSEEESLVTPDRQLIRMAAGILRSPKEFIPAASRLVESFGDGSEEDEAKEKNKPAPMYNITIDGDNATATQAGEAEAAESQMPPTIKLRRVNERWLIDQILSDDDLAAMQRSIQDVLGDGLFESEKPGKAAEAKMAGDASLADDQRHLVWENANIVHLGQSFAETLGLDEGSRAAINSLLTEMWTKYIELECEHTEYSRTHDGKLQADVGKFSEARDRLTHEFWMKLGEIVPASAREHIFALASAGSQETPSLLGWQEPFYPARVQIRSNGTGFHWYVRPGKHGITGDGKTLPFELAHYLTLGQQNLDGDKRVVPAGTASPPDVSIETGD